MPRRIRDKETNELVLSAQRDLYGLPERGSSGAPGKSRLPYKPAGGIAAPAGSHGGTFHNEFIKLETWRMKYAKRR